MKKIYGIEVWPLAAYQMHQLRVHLHRGATVFIHVEQLKGVRAPLLYHDRYAGKNTVAIFKIKPRKTHNS